MQIQKLHKKQNQQRKTYNKHIHKIHTQKTNTNQQNIHSNGNIHQKQIQQLFIKIHKPNTQHTTRIHRPRNM